MKTEDKIRRVRVEIGDRVEYISDSGRCYNAEITKVYPHFGTNAYPQVDLKFRDERNKQVMK